VDVELGEWLSLLDGEYLSDFVAGGGAAVKFVAVPDVSTALKVREEVRRTAEERGFLVAEVDAALVRIHLMQQLFHEVARQVPWESLARRVVRRCYGDLGMQAGEDLQVEAVAALNAVAPGPLRADLRRSLEGLLQRSHELARDFRYAMLWLCAAQVAPSGPDTAVLLSWLRGELRLVSALKKFLIFRKIGRHNARAMLGSLSAWCRLAGLPGLALILDVRQLAVARRSEAGPGQVHYTVAAVMDAYEVLRQMIDSTDDLTGVLCVVVAEPELFDDEKRGVKVYQALYTRVWPDVRLRLRANPLSSMARLAQKGRLP
jgi:hypothetical protein